MALQSVIDFFKTLKFYNFSFKEQLKIWEKK